MDTTSSPATPPPSPRRRRLWKILAALLILPALLVAALPWIASSAPVRQAVRSYINQALAPARVELGGLDLSWFGPVTVRGIALVNKEGKTLLAAPRATLDRSLLQLIADRPRYGTLVVEGATLDLERRADGSLDLIDVFRPKVPASPAPAPAAPGEAGPDPVFTLKVKQGTLRIRTPELLEPFQAERMDVTLEIPPAPQPLSWTIGLANGTDATAEHLELTGHYDHRAKAPATPDAVVSLKASRWPFAADVAGVAARGRLDGTIDAQLKEGALSLAGTAGLFNVDASGPALAGDRLRLDRVSATWDVSQANGLWTVRRLELTSPVATISANGSIAGASSASTRLDGKVDLAALARQLPHALRLREGLALDRGAIVVRLDLHPEPEGQRLVAEVRLSDLIARDETKTITLRSPATINADASRRGDNLHVRSLVARTGFLDLSGTGDLEKGVSVTGTADLGALESQFRDLIDFGGVSLAGKAGLAADYRRKGTTCLGRFAAEFRNLRAAGLTAEPIAREALRLDASAHGLTDSTGLPQSWQDLTLGLRSGETTAKITATKAVDGGLTFAANAASFLPLAEIDTRAGLQVAGHWQAPLLELQEARVTLRPADPKAVSMLSLAAAGKFDARSGDLHLRPLEDPNGQPLLLSPAGMHVAGLGGSGAPLKVEGGLAGDLAALDKFLADWMGSAKRDLAGSWTSGLKLQRDSAGRLTFDVGLAAPALSLPAAEGARGRRDEGPIGLVAKGTYEGQADRVVLDELTLATRYARISGRGQVADPGGRRLADLRGELAPNWAMVNVLAASMVEPGAKLNGAPSRAFRLQGPLSGESAAQMLKGLDAELGIELTESDAFGLTLGPAPVVLHCQGGKAAFEPIRTTLSGGAVYLQPDLDLDDPRGLSLRLAAGSAVAGVQINDEISKRVLAYVAPVLQQATHVQGKVNASFDRAVFPIGGDETRTMTIQGAVVFDNVVFAAGPLGKDLLSVVGKNGNAALRLQQPVLLSVADGRVNQKGLAIPIARDAKIEIDGSVGFDQTLALRAVVPLTASMFGGRDRIQELAAGTKVTVPVGGTLSQPRLDVRALQVALKGVGKDLFKRGAADLLEQLAAPPSGSGGNPGQPGAGQAPARRLEDELLRRLAPKPNRP